MNADEIVKALREMATYDCGYEEESDAAMAAIDLIESLQARHEQAALNYQQKCRDVMELETQLSASRRMENAARNELCLKCGLYRDAHNGACDGCTFRERS